MKNNHHFMVLSYLACSKLTLLCVMQSIQLKYYKYLVILHIRVHPPYCTITYTCITGQDDKVMPHKVYIYIHNYKIKLTATGGIKCLCSSKGVGGSGITSHSDDRLLSLRRLSLDEELLSFP